VTGYDTGGARLEAGTEPADDLVLRVRSRAVVEGRVTAAGAAVPEAIAVEHAAPIFTVGVEHRELLETAAPPVPRAMSGRTAMPLGPESRERLLDWPARRPPPFSAPRRTPSAVIAASS
jgi:hypothetical protein